MSAIPGDIDAESSPPMTVPLRHFVVALAFLGAGLAVGVVSTRAGTLARIHLLLGGWVCLTIMGAMTQFVPVWSGVALYSRRIATAQLPLAAAGFAGLATGFLTGVETVLPLAGTVAIAGIWLFVYNVGRTLAAVETYDVTERHFAFALACFLLVTTAGLGLAANRAVGLLPIGGIGYAGLLAAHATLAVFGVVVATVAGALYQLGTMFTQSELTAVDRLLQRYELVAYPTGVVLLAGGRLVESSAVGTVGSVLLTTGTFALGVVLLRRLLDASVDWTPMLSRYVVVAVSLLAWSPLAMWAWLRDPIGIGTLFGTPATALLLLVGVVGFVVLGTLYHVVPFIVWVHRYSDRLGFDDVPMIDDLYHGRVAAVDFWCFLTAASTALLATAGLVPAWTQPLAGTLAVVGVALFAGNLLGVLVKHSPQSLAGVVFGRPGDRAG